MTHCKYSLPGITMKEAALDRFRFLLVLTGLLSLLLMAPVYAAQPSQKTIDEVEAYLEQVMKLGEIPGLSVSIYHQGKPLLERGFGYANLEWQQKVTPDTVFELASISKTFTAMAIAKLIDAGKLSLDDTLGQHVPGVPEQVHGITLRQMLTHTSGLGSFNGLPEFDALSFDMTATTADVLPSMLTFAEPLFAAGESIYYSNTAVWFLGHIIEKASGQSYGEFLKENIFEPFGMTDSYFNNYETIIPRRASGYTVGPNSQKNAVNIDPPAVPFSAGSIATSARDLQRYVFELHAGTQLSAAIRDMMYGGSLLNDGRSTLYTTGLLIQGDYHGHRKYEHAGTITGFTAQHGYYPDDEIGIVVLSNANATNNPVTMIENTIANMLFEVEIPAAQPLNEEDFDQYIGNYRFSESHDYFGDFKIYAQEGKLLLKLGGLMMTEIVPAMQLHAAGGDSLIASLYDGILVYIVNFAVDGSGESFVVNGLHYAFERVAP